MSVIAILLVIVIYGIVIPVKIIIVILALIIKVLLGALTVFLSTIAAIIHLFGHKH